MNLFKESIIYSIGYLFSRFQYFLILPFLLKKISVVDYGIVESLGVLQLFILVLIVNNFDTSLSSYYYEDQKKQKTLEIVGLISCLMNSFLVLGIFIIFSSYFTKLILGSAIYREELLIAVAWALLNAFIHYNSFLLRLQKKIKQYSFLLIFQGLVTLSLIYYFIVIKSFGVKGYLYGNLIGAFITWIITQFQVTYDYKEVDFKNYYSKLLKLAIPMFPVSISAWSLTLIDRILLAKLSPGGLGDVGVYGFAIKIATLGSVIWGPFQLAWMPFALSSFKKENVIDNLERAASWFFYLSYIIIILISFLCPIIINLLFPAQYRTATAYIGPLMICSFFNIAYYLPYTSLIQMKKLYPVTMAFISASLLNLMLNLLLIPKLGIVGAIVSNIGGYLVIFGITLFFSQKNDYPRYFRKEYLLAFILMVVAIVSSSYLKQDSYTLRVSVAFFSCLLITLIFANFSTIDFKMLPRMIKDKSIKIK
jgi:O-antigen/teichoic acid export membrane protein